MYKVIYKKNHLYRILEKQMFLRHLNDACVI